MESRICARIRIYVKTGADYSFLSFFPSAPRRKSTAASTAPSTLSSSESGVMDLPSSTAFFLSSSAFSSSSPALSPIMSLALSRSELESPSMSLALSRIEPWFSSAMSLEGLRCGAYVLSSDSAFSLATKLGILFGSTIVFCSFFGNIFFLVQEGEIELIVQNVIFFGRKCVCRCFEVWLRGFLGIFIGLKLVTSVNMPKFAD